MAASWSCRAAIVGPVLDHHAAGRFVGSIDPAAIDPTSCVALEAPAGAITIHHVRLLHGSAPNTSGGSRRLFLIEYIAGDAWPLVGADWLELQRPSVPEGRHFARPTDGICPGAHPIASQRALGVDLRGPGERARANQLRRTLIAAIELLPHSNRYLQSNCYLQSKRTPPMPGSCAARTRVHVRGVGGRHNVCVPGQTFAAGRYGRGRTGLNSRHRATNVPCHGPTRKGISHSSAPMRWIPRIWMLPSICVASPLNPPRGEPSKMTFPRSRAKATAVGDESGMPDASITDLARTQESLPLPLVLRPQPLARRSGPLPWPVLLSARTGRARDTQPRQLKKLGGEVAYEPEPNNYGAAAQVHARGFTHRGYSYGCHSG